MSLINHFKGKRLSAPHGDKREGLHIPMTLWQCYCGRRFRGEVALHGHLERSGHGVAVAVTRG